MRTVAVAVAVAAVALTMGGCGNDHSPGDSGTAPVGARHLLSSPPLAARANALGLFTGREVVFLGGDRHPCAPTVSCDAVDPNPHGPGNNGMTRQAAAYDLRTQTWHRITPVPAYVDAGSEAAYAAGRIFVDTTRGWFAYDVRHDTWNRFHGRWRRGYGLSPVADVIYGESQDGSTAIAYDVRSRHWHTYPPDRITPQLGGLTITGTPSGPVLGGYDLSRPYNIHHGSPALVDVWDQHRWRRLGQAGQIERGWVWTGRRLVDPTLGVLDHGDEYKWPRAYPWGGILDSTTGQWRALPAALEKTPQGWDTTSTGWPAASGGSGWFVTDGRVYDDATGRAWPLPRPPGAPQVYSSAVWAHGTLVAFGGANYSGQDLTQLTNRAWIYTP